MDLTKCLHSDTVLVGRSADYSPESDKLCGISKEANRETLNIVSVGKGNPSAVLTCPPILFSFSTLSAVAVSCLMPSSPSLGLGDPPASRIPASLLSF